MTSDVGRRTTARSDIRRPCSGAPGQSPTDTGPPAGGEPDVVVYAPLDETMRVVAEQMAKWKTTLDWLAER